MRRTRAKVALFILLAVSAAVAKEQPKAKQPPQTSAALWSDPGDITSRNLFYGSGGERDQPHGTMTFLKEDKGGTNPKFDVRDGDGTRWRVKLGVEARPETVAAHLLWAVGYFADEDYFVPSLTVENMPAHLKRGQNLLGPGGVIHNVRLKRHVKGEKKIGRWKWKQNLFRGTREFNGLRVMMALINNWDLIDENNSIYEESDPPQTRYLVSDLGSSFGKTGYSWNSIMSKDNLKAYSHSKFITKIAPDYVDFSVPKRPPLLYFFNLGWFFTIMHTHWIGKHIPRADAKWMGEILAQLSSAQIRDAFRSAGYSPPETEAYAEALEKRIAELKRL
jgi:hypothetical protein